MSEEPDAYLDRIEAEEIRQNTPIMRLVHLEERSHLGPCRMCDKQIPARGCLVFENTDKGLYICGDCTKNICRAYLASCLGASWERAE